MTYSHPHRLAIHGALGGVQLPIHMKSMMGALKHVPKAHRHALMIHMLNANPLSGAMRTTASASHDMSSLIQFLPPPAASAQQGDASLASTPSPATVGPPSGQLMIGNDGLASLFAKPKVTTAFAAQPPMKALADDMLGADDPEHVDEGDLDPLQHLENAIAGVVQHKASQKAANKLVRKPAAAESLVSTTSKAPTMKRPAAAITHVHGVDMTDVFDKLKRVKKGECSYGAYTSRAFDTAKRRALKAGSCHADALTFARKNFAIAADMYYKR